MTLELGELLLHRDVRVVHVDVHAEFGLGVDDDPEHVEEVTHVDLVATEQHLRRVRGLQHVVAAGDVAPRELGGVLADLGEHLQEPLLEHGRKRRAGEPGERTEAHVELVGSWIL